MIGQKKSLRKITMATSVVAMAIGAITAFSFEANAQATTGGIYRVQNCTIYEGDIIIGQGNTCPTGTANCKSNPC